MACDRRPRKRHRSRPTMPRGQMRIALLFKQAQSRSRAACSTDAIHAHLLPSLPNSLNADGREPMIPAGVPVRPVPAALPGWSHRTPRGLSCSASSSGTARAAVGAGPARAPMRRAPRHRQAAGPGLRQSEAPALWVSGEAPRWVSGEAPRFTCPSIRRRDQGRSRSKRPSPV